MNKLRSRKLRAGLSLVAMASLFPVLGLAQADTSAPANENKEAVKLDKYEVTGSRIKRLDAETVSPVVQMSAQEIAVQGFTTVGEALRAMPYNSGQALTPTDSGTSFTPGVSTINLRGLGNNSTLVLINGRRGVPYASPGFNGFQTVFDLNSIPAAAIEKVEVLKDGGSAVYGSDAVAGVVNIKLRRDFQGLSSSVTLGNYFNTDAFFKKASAVMGTSSAKTSIVAAVSFEQQSAVFARDLTYSRNADKSEFINQGNAYWTAHGWQDLGYKSEAEYFAAVNADGAAYGYSFVNPVSDEWFTLGDARSSRGFPGYVVVGGKQRTFASGTSTPTVAGSISGYNPFNFQSESGLFPEYRLLTFYTSMRQEINDQLYAFAEVSFSRNHSIVYSASTPADMEDSNGLAAGTARTTDGLHIPSYNPYNPWATDIYTGRRRLSEVGPRTNDVTSDTPRLLAGLGGTFADGWTWESGAMYSKNSVSNISKNAVADYRLQQALMGLTRLSDGSLTWNPATANSNRVFFNWFGQNETAMADFLRTTNPTSASLEYINYDISASGTIFRGLPYGAIGIAVGAEQRQEKFANVRSDLNATGNILGGDEGTTSFGDRHVTAVYAEADIPLLKNLPFVQSLEAQLAGRYEEYSDKGFAKQARPKVGLKYRPLNWLIVRGSFAKSFKAPDLAYLYTSSTTTFSSSKVLDPITKTKDQLKVITGGNRNLKPELTDTYYAGFSIAPTGKLQGLDVSVDWFDFKQTNLLASLSDFYGYSQFLSEAAAGNPLFAGKVERNPADNKVVFIRDNYENLSRGEYRGMDYSISYLWKTHGYGNLYAGVQATWIDRNSVDDSNMVGGYLVARWNGTTTLSWSKGDWGVNLFGVYRGPREYHASAGTWFSDTDELFYNYNIKSQYTQNVNVVYKGFRNIELTAGVNNVLNSTPPVDFTDAVGTTAGVNTAEPAFWYVRAEMKF